MLITGWVETVVASSIALLVLALRSASERLWAVAFALAVAWALSELWEAQHWYELAVASQGAYQRDIARFQQGYLQGSEKFRWQPKSVSDYADCRYVCAQSRCAKAIFVPTPLVFRDLATLRRTALQERNSRSPAVADLKGQETLPAWSLRRCPKIFSDLPPQTITADLPYENHNQNRATPTDFI
jgi:hypothetical protein